MGMKDNRSALRFSSGPPEDHLGNLGQDASDTHTFWRRFQLFGGPFPKLSDFKNLFYLVLAETSNQSFVINDYRWVAW